ncbi:MAG: serine hydrolase domain-containing protein [Candidatus Hydrogenedentota bacterium]
MNAYRLYGCSLILAVVWWGFSGCGTPAPDAAPAHHTPQLRAPGEANLSAAGGDANMKALIEFQNQRIRPTEGRGFRLKEDSAFFSLDWGSPTLVERVLGGFPLEAHWYDADLNPVEKASAPGRYAVVLEGVAPNGMVVRRGRTFYARPADWRPELQALPEVTIEYLPASPIRRRVWDEQAPHFTGKIAEEFVRGLMMEEEGAILLAGLTEMEPLERAPLFTEHAEVLHDEHHLAIKRQRMGMAPVTAPTPALPRQLTRPAPRLREGTAHEAGVESGTAERLAELCQTWYMRSGEPFVTLVARRGIIVYHEAVGRTFDGPVPLDAQFRVASITKAICGQMFALFMDQNLIDLDDPVGRYFPEFPTEGGQAITLRHCFTHTTGLDGHGIWGGMRNPYLENVIANGIDYLAPGRVHRYNGMGYDLAAKVMELVSGKSFVRLFHEHLFRPLGLDEIPFFDLGFSMAFNARDLATIGQLMANRGAYGDQLFYSPATFDRLLPRPLSRFFPGLGDQKEWKNTEWGVGLVWMREPAPDNRGWLLSKNVVGHGSASGCILRVDLDHDLVIAQVRRTTGNHYDEHVARFLEILDASLRG